MASRRHPRRVDKDDADVDIKAKPYGCHLSRPYLLFTEFLYVGTGFPWLGLPFTSVSPIRLNIPSFTEFYWVVPSFLGFHRVLVGFYLVLLGFTGFNRVSHGISGFYWIILSYIRFHEVQVGFTGFHQVLMGFTGFYWVVVGYSWFYWVLLGFTGFY